MEIRHADYDDIKRQDFRDLVSRGLKANEIGMVPSWDKLESLAEMCVESNGRIVAHLMGLVGENPMFYGMQGSVIAWYSEHPGAGFALFRRFVDWAAKRHVSSFAVHTNYNPELNDYFEDNGWVMCPSYMKVVRNMDS